MCVITQYLVSDDDDDDVLTSSDIPTLFQLSYGTMQYGTASVSCPVKVVKNLLYFYLCDVSYLRLVTK